MRSNPSSLCPRRTADRISPSASSGNAVTSVSRRMHIRTVSSALRVASRLTIVTGIVSSSRAESSSSAQTASAVRTAQSVSASPRIALARSSVSVG
jgi:hypothetical protein